MTAVQKRYTVWLWQFSHTHARATFKFNPEKWRLANRKCSLWDHYKTPETGQREEVFITGLQESTRNILKTVIPTDFFLLMLLFSTLSGSSLRSSHSLLTLIIKSNSHSLLTLEYWLYASKTETAFLFN